MSRTLYQIVLHLSVIVLGVLVIVLARQNMTLKSRQPPEEKSLAVGDVFVTDAVRSLDTLQSDAQASRSLIFVFSTRCQFCVKSIPSWQRLAKEASSIGLPVIGVSVDSLDLTKKFKEEHDITFPVVNAFDPVSFRRANHVTGVPLSLIRSKENKVERLWIGVVTPETFDEMERAISQSKNNKTAEAL